MQLGYVLAGFYALIGVVATSLSLSSLQAAGTVVAIPLLSSFFASNLHESHGVPRTLWAPTPYSPHA